MLYSEGGYQKQDFRKESSEKGMTILPTFLRFELTIKVDDYQQKASMS